MSIRVLRLRDCCGANVGGSGLAHDPLLGRNKPLRKNPSTVKLVWSPPTSQCAMTRNASSAIFPRRASASRKRASRKPSLFAHHSDVVLNVGLLVDTGTRMSRILGEEADASKPFLRRVVRPTDPSFLVSYASVRRLSSIRLRREPKVHFSG